MNITKILCKLLILIGHTADELLNNDSAYKTVIKQIRLKLKQLHTDAGGDSEEFDSLHKIYETLLAYKKQTTNYEQEVKNSLTLLSKNPDLYKDVTISNAKLNLEDIFNQTVIVPTTRKCFVQTNIAELVLHFNKLCYCQVQEQAALLHDLVTVPIKVSAAEPTGNGKLETSTADLTRCLRHAYNGQYNTTIALELKAGSTLKIEVQGFEQAHILDIDKTAGFSIVFEENLVKLTILIQITVV